MSCMSCISCIFVTNGVPYDRPLAPVHVNIDRPPYSGYAIRIYVLNIMRGTRNEASAAKGGRQAQESCGDTTHGTSTGRRGRLVRFNDSSEYETTRTLAHTSLALAPTIVYIHQVV